VFLLFLAVADQREVAEVAMIELLPAYEFDQRVSW
jgi:hypothetical protein